MENCNHTALRKEFLHVKSEMKWWLPRYLGISGDCTGTVNFSMKVMITYLGRRLIIARKETQKTPLNKSNIARVLIWSMIVEHGKQWCPLIREMMITASRHRISATIASRSDISYWLPSQYSSGLQLHDEWRWWGPPPNCQTSHLRLGYKYVRHQDYQQWHISEALYGPVTRIFIW